MKFYKCAIFLTGYTILGRGYIRGLNQTPDMILPAQTISAIQKHYKGLSICIIDSSDVNTLLRVNDVLDEVRKCVNNFNTPYTRRALIECSPLND